MKDKREIIIPDLDYQAEVKKCKTMEDVVGKNGLMQKLFKDIIVPINLVDTYNIDNVHPAELLNIVFLNSMIQNGIKVVKEIK